MTRILTDGAEFGDGLFFELGNALTTTSQKRTGNYSYYSQGAAGTTPEKLLPTHMSEFYFRYCCLLVDGGVDWWELVDFNHVSTNVIRLKLDTDLHLHIFVGDTDMVTGIYPFTNDYWHIIDMHICVATSGSVQVKLDGVMDMQYFGDTRGNSQTEIDRFIFGASYHLGFYPWQYIDDIALNNTSGSVDNTWCGDGHVELLRPNAEGDLLEWVPSSGSVHYAMVDDFPPNGDTDYIGTILPNKQELFNLSAFDDTNKLVRRVYSEMRARDMSAVGQVLKLGVKTSGSTYLSDSRVLTYNYLCIKGDEMLVNPITGLAWTKDELDALQFVVNSESIIG
jgi:hypothetical protein